MHNATMAQYQNRREKEISATVEKQRKTLNALVDFAYILFIQIDLIVTIKHTGTHSNRIIQ